MNPAALFAAHKTAVLGAAAAGVAGLALLKRKSASTATAGAATPGTAAGGSVPADGFMGPDSSAYDVYNALMPELDALRQTVGQPVGPVPAPSPASPILSKDKNLVFNGKKTFTPAPAPKPAQPHGTGLIPPPAHSVDTWVTVRPGDNLSEIAARFRPTDITWQTLAQQNKISNPNVIHPGDKIHVVG